MIDIVSHTNDWQIFQVLWYRFHYLVMSINERNRSCNNVISDVASTLTKNGIVNYWIDDQRIFTCMLWIIFKILLQKSDKVWTGIAFALGRIVGKKKNFIPGKNISIVNYRVWYTRSINPIIVSKSFLFQCSHNKSNVSIHTHSNDTQLIVQNRVKLTNMH